MENKYVTFKELLYFFKQLVSEGNEFDIQYFNDLISVKLNPSKFYIGEAKTGVIITFDNCSGFRLEDVKAAYEESFVFDYFVAQTVFIYFKNGDSMFLSRHKISPK